MRGIDEESNEVGEAFRALRRRTRRKPSVRSRQRRSREVEEMGRYFVRMRREPVEWYRADVGATAKSVGAEEPAQSVEVTSPESSESGGVRMTPEAKEAARNKKTKNRRESNSFEWQC